MKRLDAHVGSFQSALEQTPEIFQPVSVDLPIDVLLGMVNGLVDEVLLLQPLIGQERIGVDRAACFDVSANLGLQVMLAPSRNHHCADFAATFQNTDDRSFVFGASLSNPAAVFVAVHVSRCAADEGFVYLNFASVPAEFQNRTILHCKTDAVKHEPCGFLSDAESASNFIGTDAVLAVGNHPNCDKPFVERERGILKDGSHFRAELFSRMFVLAFPQAPSSDEAHFFGGTGRADNASRPATLNHEVEAVVGVCKVQDGLLKGSGFLHGVPHSQKYDRNALLSQVYYCLCKC